MAADRRRLWIAVLIVLLAGLAALALFLYYAVTTVGGFGFPLDDSWIHTQIARNLATGQGWSFNPGEPTGASTAPLWVMLLALVYVMPLGDPITGIKVLGSLLYLADVVLIALLAWRVAEDWRVALIAGILAAWQPAFVWGALSGMETPLYLLLVLLGLLGLLGAERQGARSAYLGTLCLTLAGWARPEVWLLLPVGWGYLIWRRREVPGGRGWLHVGIASAGVGTYLLFNLATWGHPLSASWYAKTAFGRGNEPFDLAYRALQFAGQFMSSIRLAVNAQNQVLVVMMALGCVAAWQKGDTRWRRVMLLLAVALAGIVAAALADLGSIGLQNYRRAAHVLAVMNVLVALGAVALWDSLRPDGRGLPAVWQRPTADAKGPGTLPRMSRPAIVVALGLAGLALAMQLAGLNVEAKLYANDVRSINQGDVAAALWLANNTAPDATVAANDIGAMAYFGGRRIVDLVGLASPEVIDVLASTPRASPAREQQLKDLLFARDVDYVVIFPEWFPNLAQDPALVEVARFTVPGATMLAREVVVVYGVGSRE